VTVEGFRGVGEPVTLELPAGPGLTLVIGRNGSGKSSFAEALEVLFTGDNRRWADRSSVWREGWRNLHHPTAAIEATLAIEGIAGPTVVRREWGDEDGFDESRIEVQPHGQKKADLSLLDWGDALVTYRPFLSYSELGSMLDEGPSKLYDAVSSVLGLEDLVAAEKALRDARLARERRVKDARASRDQLEALLAGVEDDRARTVSAALQRSSIDFAAIERVVATPVATAGESEMAVLNRVAAVAFPDAEEVEAASTGLREARTELAALAGSHSDRLSRGAELLEQALAFREEFGATECPVCATPDVLTEEWAVAAAEQAREQAAAAAETRRARARAEAAEKRARALVGAVPRPIQDARELLDIQDLIDAWRKWVALEAVDAEVLGQQLPGAAEAVRVAVDQLRAQAQAEVDRRQDVWRPVAIRVASWVPEAKSAQDGARAVPDMKRAETWLKAAAVELRNERFTPIAEEAGELWRLLRQRSNVQLGRIELEGTGTRRKVTLDVTVDGVAGAALGVMSQGELHALALSLFFPRATLEESPFRFIVVDDPVQSMDPSKVDGLARVLERAAKVRQVVVFTHDDRLPEAVRRLGIDASMIEVTRGEKSRVELRTALDPVERYIEDARAVVRTEELPPETISRVVPGFCRLAVDAACIEAVRRRRIGRGEEHAAVEQLLAGVNRTTVFAALALFDDENRGGDVLATIGNRFGRSAADTFKRLNQAAHTGVDGDLRELVREAAILSRKLAESV
jgi:energy-coupling factor transporter ATP-binding protein EcfA2